MVNPSDTPTETTADKDPSLTVPIRASHAYKQAFKAFAGGNNMADMVRAAIDAKYGSDEAFQEQLSFFVKRGQRVGQSDSG